MGIKHMSRPKPKPLEIMRRLCVDLIKAEDESLYRDVINSDHDLPGGMIDDIIISEFGENVPAAALVLALAC